MPTWALRFVPTAILLVALAVAGASAVHVFREQGRDEYRPKLAALQATLAEERASRERAENAANSYLAELGNLRNRPAAASPVRLCVKPAPLPSTATTTPRFDDATSRAGGDQRPARGNLEAGPDIGPDLRSLALVCDAENAKLRALQRWVDDVR